MGARVSLALLVKDEASVIGRCIEAAAPHVHHVSALVDDRTTDETENEIRMYAEAMGLTCAVSPVTFTGWGNTRSKCLDFSRTESGCDWSLVLDADEILGGTRESFTSLDPTVAAYDVCGLYAGDWEVWKPLLFNHAFPWEFVGDLHERAVVRGEKPPTVKLQGAELVNGNDSAQGARNSSVTREAVIARYAREAERFRETLSTNQGDTRSAYYLAQSLNDACMGEEAIAAYKHRAEMEGGFQEERYLSLLQIARWCKRLGYEHGIVDGSYRDAIKFRPERNEARVELARFRNDFGRTENKYATEAVDVGGTSDTFLVQRSAYTWAPWLELARHLELIDDERSVEAWRAVLQFPNLPSKMRAALEARFPKH